MKYRWKIEKIVPLLWRVYSETGFHVADVYGASPLEAKTNAEAFQKAGGMKGE